MMRIVAGYTIGVNDHQEIAQAAQAKGDEALLAVSVGIFSGQGEFIFQDRCGFRESYVVITDVRFGFSGSQSIHTSRVYGQLSAESTSRYQRGRRGRDAGYPTPPAQIPACGFSAPGSSVRLASAIPATGRVLYSSGRLACGLRPCMSGTSFL